MSRRDDDHRRVIQRRRRWITAAFSTVTLSGMAARAQICLSVAELDPIACSTIEGRLEREPSPELVLEVAECLVEEENDLESGLAFYQRYLELTADTDETRDQRARVAWTIERLRIVLRDRGTLKEVTPAGPTAPSPAPSPAPLPTTAPPSVGPASCGCHHQAPTGEGQAAWLAGLALALLRRRWRRAPEGER